MKNNIQKGYTKCTLRTCIVVLRVLYCAKCVCFCRGHFVMVPLNLALSTLFATYFL